MSVQLEAARMLSTEVLRQKYQDGIATRRSLTQSLSLPQTEGRGDMYTALENLQEEMLVRAIVLEERGEALPRSRL